jgi:hypothetical protein
MKKSIATAKLKLSHETVKLLKSACLTGVAGGAPVTTKDLPCIELTAKDCG